MYPTQRTPRLMACLAFALLAPLALCPALAQEAPPQPGPPRPFQLPTPQTITLENGVQATFIEFGAVPKVTLVINVRAGGLNAGERVWLPSLTADLLKEGTESRTAEQIATSAALMGGQVSIGAGSDETTLALDVLSEYGPDAVELLADILTRPTLPESELERIRQNYLRNLSVALTQPQALAGAAFAALLYPDHPYGRTFPTPEQLRAYTIEDVRSFYEENFGAARTHVYVAGQFDRAAIEAAVREALGHWRRGPDPLVMPPPPPGEPRLELIERAGAPQSTLRVGLRVIDPTQPDFMPLSVANTVLGGSLTSRITMNLRETKGWAYSPGSLLTPRVGVTAWSENADVTSAHTGAALTEIFKEIERLRTEEPPEQELTAAKNYRNGVFVLSNASRGGLISQFAYMNLHGLPHDWLTTYLERMYAVTPAQVTDAARRHLDPARMSVVIVGDLETVRPQLDSVEQLTPLR